MENQKNKNAGFSLVEVIIYMALFSILMGGVFVSVFQLLEGSGKLNSKIVVQEEGNFVSRKLDWVLSSLDSSNPPTITNVPGSPCQTLTVRKVNFTSNPIVIRNNATTLEISEGGGAYTPITTPNVTVSCFEARIIPSIGSSPKGITATTTISGIKFSVTKYFRK